MKWSNDMGNDYRLTPEELSERIQRLSKQIKQAENDLYEHEHWLSQSDIQEERMRISDLKRSLANSKARWETRTGFSWLDVED